MRNVFYTAIPFPAGLLIGLMFVLSIATCRGQTLEDSLQSILDLKGPEIFDVSGLSFGGASGALIDPSGTVSVAATGVTIPGVPMNNQNLLGASDYSQTLLTILAFALVEEGVLTLNDPISTYIDASSLTNVPGSVTIQQLLSHEGGLDNFAEAPDYTSTLLFDVTKAFTPEEITELFVEAASSPGNFSYSNTHFLVLGLVLESANDSETLQESLDRLVLEPSGATNISFYQAGDPENLAPLFADVFGTGFPQQLTPNTSVFTGAGFAGNLSGTPSDMIKVLKALLDGEIISEGNLQQMLSFTTINGRPSDQYGLGIEQFTLNVGGEDRTYIGHAGTINYQTLVLYRPEDTVGVALSTNNALGSLDALLETAADFFQAYDDLGGPVTSLEVIGETESPFRFFPNPVRNQLTVSYRLAQPAQVAINVVNAFGQRVVTNLPERRSSGEHQELLGFSNALPSGQYFLELRVDGERFVRAFLKH